MSRFSPISDQIDIPSKPPVPYMGHCDDPPQPPRTHDDYNRELCPNCHGKPIPGVEYCPSCHGARYKNV